VATGGPVAKGGPVAMGRPMATSGPVANPGLPKGAHLESQMGSIDQKRRKGMLYRFFLFRTYLAGVQKRKIRVYLAGSRAYFAGKKLFGGEKSLFGRIEESIWRDTNNEQWNLKNCRILQGIP